MMCSNFQKAFYLFEEVTIDEMVIGFKGRFGPLQYNPIDAATALGDVPRQVKVKTVKADSKMAPWPHLVHMKRMIALVSIARVNHNRSALDSFARVARRNLGSV
ncbi:piggyBac transposable element-derived protein 4 [Biomphalaria glabrata]|nr:piggyBac transposable element-derived protein 4 [Biomphalaria glabrata]